MKIKYRNALLQQRHEMCKTTWRLLCPKATVSLNSLLKCILKSTVYFKRSKSYFKNSCCVPLGRLEIFHDSFSELCGGKVSVLQHICIKLKWVKTYLKSWLVFTFSTPFIICYLPYYCFSLNISYWLFVWLYLTNQ